MGLVQMHEGEYRRWHPAWGSSPSGNEEWQKILQPAAGGSGRGAVGAEHPLLSHHQLQLIPITSSPPSDLQSARARQMAMPGSGSTVVRRSAGQPLAAAYEARNVFITILPEVFLLHMHQCTAETVYQEWQECEVILGKRPRRGHA